jgi:hypothetical protein
MSMMVAVTVNIWQSNLAYLRVAIILDGNTRVTFPRYRIEN